MPGPGYPPYGLTDQPRPVTDHERQWIMSVPLVKGAEIYWNRDGSVAMWCPPAVPSPGDLEGWTVRHVCSGTHGPACPYGEFGTYSLIRTDVESFNRLLKIVSDLSAEYGYRP